MGLPELIREPDPASDERVEVVARAIHWEFAHRGKDFDPRVFDRIMPAAQDRWRAEARAAIGALSMAGWRIER